MIESQGKRETAHRLVEAITQDHFLLYGQRIVSIDPAREGSGYQEVLVRYVEEERKLLPPGGFFSVLEDLNLMSMLDRWVVSRVIRRLVGRSTEKGNAGFARYSVNLSVDSIRDGQFPAFVSELFQANNVPPGKLSFEVAEPDARAHAAALNRLILVLNPIGCGFTLTSYNGQSLPLRSLRDLGIDCVKIDSDITYDVDRSAAAYSRAGVIRTACHAVGIQTIGELVERSETLETLRGLGVDFAQGYAISQPAPLR